MYKVKLKPGQMAPEGNTGIALSDGYIVIDGDAPSEVLLGNRLDTDPVFEMEYDTADMTAADIEEYNILIIPVEFDYSIFN